jgi:membrane fusion protein (multidrug efflux system)
MTASILALAASTALTACKKKEGSGVEKAPPLPPLKVTVATVEEAPSPQQLVLTGMIAADQRSEVTADTQGKVLNVMVERGQRVKMGAAVVQLDVRTSALAAREAQANLASARAQRELAEQECVRTKQLLEKGAITRSEYDRQTTQCTSALEQVSAAEARTQMMIKSVADGIVRAPFDGVVTQRSVSPGEFVSPGKPLFTLVDDDPLKIELSVPEAYVSKIAQGQEVQLLAVATGDKPHRAKVTRIGAEVGRTRSLIVEATLEPGSGLVPGMFAEAHITIDKPMRAVVPKDAVVQRGKTRHVFIVKIDEKDKTRSVKDEIVQVAPAEAADKVAIVKGVVKGDRVVVINAAEEKELADLKQKLESSAQLPEPEKQKLQRRLDELTQKQITDGRSVVE